MNGIYLYGVVDSTADKDLGLPGLDGKAPVRVISEHGLGCLVSCYEGCPFDAQSKDMVLRNLLTHQRIVEGAMKDHTVLPAKFGTLLADRQEVKALLSRHHSLLDRALESIRDKVEVEVAATWDIGQVLQEVSADSEIASVREAPARAEGPTMAARIRLGQMVKAHMDRRRKAYQESMIDLIRPVVLDMKFNALVSDEMVMNVAFLLEKSSYTLFEDKVSTLDMAFQDRIDFRVIGPLPPYSFSTLEVVKLRRYEVCRAMEQLGLQRVESEVEVRRAYRRLAADKQHGRDTAHAGVLLDDLKRASDLLLRCVRGVDTGDKGSPSRTSLDIDAWEDMLMVSTTARNQEDIEPARFGAALEV
jgi:hypothetical protein